MFIFTIVGVVLGALIAVLAAPFSAATGVAVSPVGVAAIAITLVIVGLVVDTSRLSGRAKNAPRSIADFSAWAEEMKEDSVEAYPENSRAGLSDEVRITVSVPGLLTADAHPESAEFLRTVGIPALRPVTEEFYVTVLSSMNGDAARAHYLDGDTVLWVTAWEPGIILIRMNPDGTMEAAALRDARPDLARGLPLRELALVADGTRLEEQLGFVRANAAEQEAFDAIYDPFTRLDDAAYEVSKQEGWERTAQNELAEWAGANAREWAAPPSVGWTA